jgi:hypothetical protein
LINSNSARIAFKALIGKARSPAATSVAQHLRIAKPIFDAGSRSVALALHLPKPQAAGNHFSTQTVSTFTKQKECQMSSFVRLIFSVLTALVLSVCFSATHSALAQANGTTGIIISEFRFDGPNGTNDEFVEIVNNSATPKTIISSDAGGTKGFSVWGIVGGQARKVCTIPFGTLLLAGQHYLCAKVPGYELAGYSGAQNDNINNYTTTFSLSADGAVALFSSEDVIVNNDGTITTTGTVFREDAVGFRELNLAAPNPLAAALREGAGLNPIGPQDPASRAGRELREYSFVRKHVSSGNGTWSGATYQDTNNNLADFALVANIGDGPIDRAGVTASAGQLFAATAFDPSPVGSPGSQTATTPVFGAPGPQSTTSPVERNYNTQFLRSLFDTGSAANVSPNIERNSQIVCGGSKGDLVLRFTYKNSTGVVQNNLRVRWIDMSTVNRNNASFTAVLDLLDSTAATRTVAVNNGSDTPTNDPAPSGDGIVNTTAAGSDGVKVARGTYVEGVDKTPPVLAYVVTSPSSGNFTATTNQNFRQVNPSFTDTDGSPGSPCRVGGFNSATVAAPPTAGVTTTALPAPLVNGGSISLEHRFGVIKQGTFVIVGIIESN